MGGSLSGNSADGNESCYINTIEFPGMYILILCIMYMESKWESSVIKTVATEQLCVTMKIDIAAIVIARNLGETISVRIRHFAKNIKDFNLAWEIVDYQLV